MRLSTRIVALTFLGGALGTAGRFALSGLLGNSLLPLFVVNLLGAFALGLFNTSKKFDSDALRAFWGIGFAGGFTTMSGVAVSFVVESGSPVFITLAVLAMFGLGVLSYRLGSRFGSGAVAS